MRAHALLLAVTGDGIALYPAAVVLRPDRHVGYFVDLRHHDRTERLYLFVADALGVDRAGRFHERERKDLHDVVLHDVAQSAGFFVEIAPLFYADRLRHGDLDVVDVIARPQGLEYGVGKTQRQDVLDGLFTEVVVDPVNLVLVEDVVQGGVELAGSGQVAAERLFDHEAGKTAALWPVETHLPERPGHFGEDVGHRRQVVGPVATRPQGLVDFLEPGLEFDERLRVGIVPGYVGAVLDYFRPPGPGVPAPLRP